jgi:hypothetical protein
MMSTDRDGAILRELSRLPQPGPDAVRRERVIARCHAALARRRPSAPAQPAGTLRGAGRLELLLTGAFCLLYLAAILCAAVPHLAGS